MVFIHQQILFLKLDRPAFFYHHKYSKVENNCHSLMGHELKFDDQAIKGDKKLKTCSSRLCENRSFSY